MTINRLIFAAFLVCTTFLVRSQSAPMPNLDAFSSRGMSDVDVSVFNLNKNTTLGSPLLTSQWSPGHLMLVDQDTFGYEIDVNIDFYKQQLYFRLSNGHINVITTKFVQAVRIDTSATQSLFFRVFPKNEVEGGKSDELNFYQVLFQGPEYSLLKGHYRSFRKADTETPYGTSRTYDEYKDKTLYWLQVGNKPYEKLKLQAKTVEKALSSDKTKIEQLKTWNTLDLNTEDGVAALLKLLDNAK